MHARKYALHALCTLCSFGFTLADGVLSSPPKNLIACLTLVSPSARPHTCGKWRRATTVTTSPSSCLSFRGYPLRPQAQGPLHQGLRWFAERVVVCATAQHCSAACNFRAGCDDHAMKARSTLHRCSHRPLSLSNVPCAGRCLRGVDGERRAGSASALTATGRVPACTSRCADCATVSISCNDRDFLRVAGCELLQVLQPRPCATALGVVPVSLLLQLCAALDGSLC